MSVTYIQQERIQWQDYIGFLYVTKETEKKTEASIKLNPFYGTFPANFTALSVNLDSNISEPTTDPIRLLSPQNNE